MARRPRRTTIDPQWLQHGAIGEAGSTSDDYFVTDETTPLGRIVDRFLDDLPPDEADAVGLVVVAGLTYRQAGEYQDCDPKTVWRRVQRGLARLAERFDAQWAGALLDDHVEKGIDVREVARQLADQFMEDAYRHT